MSRLANYSLNIISDLSININLAIHDIHRSYGLSLRPLPISGLHPANRMRHRRSKLLALQFSKFEVTKASMQSGSLYRGEFIFGETGVTLISASRLG